MININELRRGNKFMYGESIITVYDITSEGINIQNIYDLPECYFDYRLTDLSPVPLTAKVLENCGFTQHHDNCYSHPIYIKNIFSDGPYTWGVFPVDGSGVIIDNSLKLHSLHQLQNLYFALTGEELTTDL
jgi:hypothetical protein